MLMMFAKEAIVNVIMYSFCRSDHVSPTSTAESISVRLMSMEKYLVWKIYSVVDFCCASAVCHRPSTTIYRLLLIFAF